MSRKSQLLVIAVASIAIASVVSHLVTRRLNFRTEAVVPLSFGAKNLPVRAAAAGSSLMFFGIDWSRMAESLGVRARGWAVPVGSVYEMEVLERAAAPVEFSFLGVSMSDLNENYLTDFRAEIVPIRKTLADLRQARADWAYSKRVLSQYPLKYLRVLFPTAGRSAAVMVGVREELRKLRRAPVAREASERAVVSSDANLHQDRISTWPADRLQRNLGNLRASASGNFRYKGLKGDALFSFLRRGATQGKVVVIVLPESPIYTAEFVTADALRSFEALLDEAKTQVPEAIWVRLDKAPELQSKDNYWDLVHMNAPGQAMATKMLIDSLAAAGISRN